MQRLRWLAGLAVVILLLPLLRSVAAEPIVLKVGISEPVNTVLAIWMADAAGFYEAAGIKLEIINMNGGSRGAEELAAGRIHAMHVGLSSVIRLNRTGGDLRIVASLANVIRFTFFSGPDVKTAADLKGKKLSATGGGVGGFNWRMGREVLKTAGLTVDDAQFIPSATAGRLPGLVAGQIDGVALHPEDVYLAQKQKPSLNLLVQLAELMPDYMFNAYGASLDWIARDRALLRDAAAAMIEANRMMYNDKAKVVPIIEKATGKPKEAVEYAIDVLTKNCVWSINGGLDPVRTAWTIDNSAENGDIEKDKKPSPEQVANFALAKEAVDAAGGPVSIGNCKD